MNNFDQTSVKPIRFKALPEEAANFDDKNYEREASREDHQEIVEEKPEKVDLTPDIILRPENLSHLEGTNPAAVIFNNVCFNIERSLKESNPFIEYLNRIKSCIIPGLSKNANDSHTKKKIEILKSVDLRVPYGSIFGLLGPSSCGKTTLLRTLVGLLTPNSGFIQLFGKSLEDDSKACCFECFCCQSNSGNASTKATGRRSANCKVPGANVGYMPQDLGLYEDFTIRQLLTMFGQYMLMSSKLIKKRIEFMASFLDLPEVDRIIISLSGGQKRRVSFAIACLHMPPLIILDEPTVGVDPILRQSIWKYLRRLADEENKTIIITTHYIEEAAQADQVALMRAGEILIQDTPNRIMDSHDCGTLEEAFLKICNNIQQQKRRESVVDNEHIGIDITDHENQPPRLTPRPKFKWSNQIEPICDDEFTTTTTTTKKTDNSDPAEQTVRQLKLRAQAKMAIFDGINQGKALALRRQQQQIKLGKQIKETISSFREGTKSITINDAQPKTNSENNYCDNNHDHIIHGGGMLNVNAATTKVDSSSTTTTSLDDDDDDDDDNNKSGDVVYQRSIRLLILAWALLYKNFRRNINSLPLLAFQFLLPIMQLISFSLCVGGRPTNVGLGIVNLDQLTPLANLPSNLSFIVQPQTNSSALNTTSLDHELPTTSVEELLSTKYLSFIDQTMLSIKPYSNLKDALNDVRRAKLWAVLEFGENFTTTLLERLDLENFYQLDTDTILHSVIKVYPDKTNKVLDLVCYRSLVNSFREFAFQEFDFRLPIEQKEPIFDIKSNLISNSIDGYTESMAAGLLASLTYIMAAGLTTFMMVLERSKGILERTYTSGINPVAYLLAHAVFRSIVMMFQIGVIMVLTFYILRQPLVGSFWLAYLMLMTLNITGISYGLLISSIVEDQNGAALIVVSSLIVKLTMSGLLWPFEAIPRWLRAICYIQPLTMPIQALKSITLKGRGLGDKVVSIGFLVSITWLLIFLAIASKRFKFYQH